MSLPFNTKYNNFYWQNYALLKKSNYDYQGKSQYANLIFNYMYFLFMEVEQHFTKSNKFISLRKLYDFFFMSKNGTELLLKYM